MNYKIVRLLNPVLTPKETDLAYFTRKSTVVDTQGYDEPNRHDMINRNGATHRSNFQLVTESYRKLTNSASVSGYDSFVTSLCALGQFATAMTVRLVFPSQFVQNTRWISYGPLVTFSSGKGIARILPFETTSLWQNVKTDGQGWVRHDYANSRAGWIVDPCGFSLADPFCLKYLFHTNLQNTQFLNCFSHF